MEYIARIRPIYITAWFCLAGIDSTKYSLGIIVVIIWFFVLSAWWYSLAEILHAKNKDLPVNFRLFKMGFTYISIIFYLAIFIDLIPYLSKNNSVFYVEIIFIIIGAYFWIIQLTTMAKMIGNKNGNNPPKGGEITKNIILLYFLPIGIWWLYPVYIRKINEVLES